MKKHIALLCLLLTEAVFFASWPTTLYLDGGGRWDYRKPIFFENKGAEDIVGESVAIKIPQDAPFIGQAAGTLRMAKSSRMPPSPPAASSTSPFPAPQTAKPPTMSITATARHGRLRTS